MKVEASESEGAATAKGAEEPRQPERSSEASEELRHPERSAAGAESKDRPADGESAGEHQHAEGIGHGNSTLEII